MTVLLNGDAKLIETLIAATRRRSMRRGKGASGDFSFNRNVHHTARSLGAHQRGYDKPGPAVWTNRYQRLLTFALRSGAYAFPQCRCNQPRIGSGCLHIWPNFQAGQFPEVGLGMRKRRQLPRARATGRMSAIDRYFDQIRPIRLDCRLEHTFEIAARSDRAASTPIERASITKSVLNSCLVLSIWKLRRELLAEHAELHIADRAITVVVPYHPHRGNIVFLRGCENVRRHQERTVADDGDCRAFRLCEFGAEMPQVAKPMEANPHDCSRWRGRRAFHSCTTQL